MNESRMAKLTNETLRELADTLCKRMVDHGMDYDQAMVIADDSVNALTAQFGGQLIYFPINRKERKAQRNAEIIARFNGCNHDQLAREFGLSVQTVYDIVRLKIDGQRSIFDD